MDINNKIKISIVIFDMDGLMFDTERLAMEAWGKVCREAGLFVRQQEINMMKGLSIENSERVMKKVIGKDFPFKELSGKKEHYMLKHIYENGVPVKDGLYELLDYLDHKNILKAVATSTLRKKAEMLLEMANISDRFDFKIFGDEVSKGKPDPEIFSTAVKKAGCPAQECVVLEDSENGVIAAIKANTKVVFIKDMEDIPAQLKSLVYKEFISLKKFSNYLENNL
jgi:HAD superfamily hydrolase (TIGR01509 family)